MRRRRLYRIGYAAQGQDTSFDREVRDRTGRAAEREHIELIVVDNRYQPKIALRSADYLIKEQVDLVIEFQTDEVIAPAIASKYLEANIPFIAIDIPHPGATYFGANNYQAGLIGGHYLGRWAKRNWNGEPDEILLIEIQRAGSLPKARMRGMLTGISEVMRHAGAAPDRLARWRRAVSDLARTGAQASAGNQGEARAGGGGQRFQRARRAAGVQEAGRADDCVIVGQNAEPEARAELRTPDTRLIASVALFPGKVRRRADPAGVGSFWRGKPVPPAVFTNHQMITPENVDHFYPNDSLLTIPA